MFIREIYDGVSVGAGLPRPLVGRGDRAPTSGFVLLLSLVLMVSLSAVMGALIVALTTDFRGASVQSSDAKAFWLAEAGIADAVKRLGNNEINLNDGATDNSTMQNISLGDGTYSVTLSRTGSDITVTSTGTVNNQSRTVVTVQTLRQGWPQAFQYAVFGSNTNNRTLAIGQNNAATVTISGDLYYDPRVAVDGVLVRNNSKVINGLIYADTVTGGGTYTKAPVNPIPRTSYPSFSATTYDNLITIALSAPRPNLSLSGTQNLNLSGGTVYYNNVNLSSSATITGPGTLVARRIVFIANSATIKQGVNMIAGVDIVVRDNAVVQKDGILYARRNLRVRDNGKVTSSLLAPTGQFEIYHNASVTGIVFANQSVLLNSGGVNNSVINGSLVTNRFAGNRIEGRATINFGASYLPASVPTGFTSGSTISKKADSWKEV